MNWLSSLYSRQSGLSWAEFLRDLPKAILWGMMTGPVIALVFQSVLAPKHLRELVSSPLLLLLCGVAGTFFSVNFWIVMGYGNRVMRMLLQEYPQGLRLPIMVVYNSVGASFAFSISALEVTRIPGPIHFEIPYFWQTMVIDGVIGGVLAIVIGSFMKLKREVESAQMELREKALNEQRLAEQAAIAQSQALQAQINPHFFFNTLNTISVLVEMNPGAAKDMINRLADLFRYTLRCSQGQLVPLEQELQFVRDYLEIEQARFQKRLRVEWPELPVPEVKVPGLVMQPLVENAVKHGIARALEGGVVRIAVETLGDVVRISVGNSAVEFAGATEPEWFPPGHALDNVRSRLRRLTGREEPLELKQSAGWTEMAFRI